MQLKLSSTMLSRNRSETLQSTSGLMTSRMLFMSLTTCWIMFLPKLLLKRRLEELGKETKIHIKTRHLSFSQLNDTDLDNFEASGRVTFLRTFLPVDLNSVPFDNEKALCIILPNLKYFRVLSFQGFQDLDVLPNSIGELIHLRYLNLSFTKIKTLPESLCNLFNLQILKLNNCQELAMLPSGMQNLVNLFHLDIEGTYLEEMPRGMSKLTHLQHLSSFIVGNHDENGIKELGKLSNLSGSLSIEKLENVTNSIEALEARMADKKHLGGLGLEWSGGDDFMDSQSEMDILSQLQPHQHLKMLRIDGYRGTRFPDWVGHSSYSNMSWLCLSKCRNCCMLPPLGQLPFLKHLSIERIDVLETIGAEFFKIDDSFTGTPFPSLEHLEFNNMPCWEVWQPFESNAFPKLNVLKIGRCPSLRGDLPTHLPVLKVLSIVRCEQLASSLPMAPSIRELIIRESDKVMLQELPLSLEELTINGSLGQVMESMFEAIGKTQPTSSLQNLYIGNCSSALSFPGDCLPASLKSLDIWNFRKLEFPKQQYQHELLESLRIDNSCDSLTSFPLGNFPNLNNFRFQNCENLECVLVPQSQATALQRLRDFIIAGCPNFVSFPREGLSARSMTGFVISRCDKLKSLPCHMNTLLPKLEYLSIGDCPEMESFPEGGVSPSLRSLAIRNCDKLLRSPSLASIEVLTELHIRGPCDGIKSFPMVGLVLLPASLTFLCLDSLKSLETLECKELLHLTSLQQLEIFRCPKLENVAGERFPASLMKLKIYDCPLLEERCQMKHPQIWPKISHIRGIMVKERRIS